MIWLITRLRRDFGTWDRETRIAFAAAVILLIAAVAVALSAPPEARLPILVGAGLLLVVVEISVLWGNRGMISTFTRAQRLYLDGELEAARDRHPPTPQRELALEPPPPEPSPQAVAERAALDQLHALDPDSLTPRAAFDTLYELAVRLKRP